MTFLKTLFNLNFGYMKFMYLLETVIQNGTLFKLAYKMNSVYLQHLALRISNLLYNQKIFHKDYKIQIKYPKQMHLPY